MTEKLAIVIYQESKVTSSTKRITRLSGKKIMILLGDSDRFIPRMLVGHTLDLQQVQLQH